MSLARLTYSSYPSGNPVTNDNLHKFEDKVIQAVSKPPPQATSHVPNVSSLGIGFKAPVRPGYGSRGRKISFWTNHFEIKFQRDSTLHRYEIAINSLSGQKTALTGRGAARIIQVHIDKLSREYHGHVATDFRKFVISDIKIDPKFFNQNIPHLAEDELESTPQTLWSKVTLEPVGSVMVQDLVNYLSSADLQAT